MYYTLRLRGMEKQLWDVIKYTNIPKTTAILRTADRCTYNKSETIKSSLSYGEARGLIAILRKLNPERNKNAK